MKVFKIREGAKLPTKTDGNMCYDIYASIPDARIVLMHGIVSAVPTGIKIALPPGYHASIRGRSGLAFNDGVQILGGQIDNNYRGEWLVLMTTALDRHQLIIRDGDKIAQVKLEKDETFPVVEVVTEEELGTTNRGEKGFGSSGKN
jgi:dUTP pyrophosphatase